MLSNRMRRRPVLAATIGAALVLGACASDASPSPAADGDTEIEVTLQEWAIIADRNSAPAGEITFVITNDGPDDIHELVIFQTDLAPAALPVDDRGVVDESGGELVVVDEVEDIAVGATVELNVNLESGAYVLVCNIYDEDEAEAHYAEGMRSGFSVP